MNLNNYVIEDFKKPLGVFITKDRGNYQPYFHWHSHYELTIIEEGKYTVESNTTVIRNDGCAICVHRPYSLHKVNADENRMYSRRVIHVNKRIFGEFPMDIVDRSIFSESNFIFARPDKSELAELIYLSDDMYKCVGSRFFTPPDYDEKKGALLAALIFHDIMKILKAGRGETFLTRHSYIQDALQIISENLSETMTVDELALRFNVGHTKFAEDFKSVTGSTYKKYLTDLRMTRAGELLQSGSEIINAALETGYSSEAHFIAAFRKYWGRTPGEWKRQ